MSTTFIDAIGAARRLQALGVAGYGTRHLADLLVAHHLHVRTWQRHGRVRVHEVTHQRIAYTYERLWDTDGGSTQAREHAHRCGWQPFEAWTDSTVDDPGAYPYGDPEQLQAVDDVLLARVRVGQRDYVELTPAEKLALLGEHLGRGGTVRGFINRYRPVPRRELRYLLAQSEHLWPLLGEHDLSAFSLPEVAVL